MDSCFKPIFSFLNNSSVAAFVGAFSAYFLVALTDWRRRWRRRELVKRRIIVIRNIAEKKIETADRNITLIRGGRFTSAPVMPFPVEDVRALCRDALDVLSETQINALDALVYWMAAIDGIFERARSLAEELEQMPNDGSCIKQRIKIGERMQAEFGHAEKNLGFFLSLSQFYIDGEPEKILKFEQKITAAV